MRVIVIFKGREIKSAETGLGIIQAIARTIEEMATADSKPSLKGNNMSVEFTPKKQKNTKENVV